MLCVRQRYGRRRQRICIWAVAGREAEGRQHADSDTGWRLGRREDSGLHLGSTPGVRIPDPVRVRHLRLGVDLGLGLELDLGLGLGQAYGGPHPGGCSPHCSRKEGWPQLLAAPDRARVRGISQGQD